MDNTTTTLSQLESHLSEGLSSSELHKFSISAIATSCGARKAKNRRKIRMAVFLGGVRPGHPGRRRGRGGGLPGGTLGRRPRRAFPLLTPQLQPNWPVRSGKSFRGSLRGRGLCHRNYLIAEFESNGPGQLWTAPCPPPKGPILVGDFFRANTRRSEEHTSE